MPSTITSLEILPANGLVAIDGADAADMNGAAGRLTLPDDGASAFDPTKIVLMVEDPGFSAPGVAATMRRTIRGTAILRTQTPNGTPANQAYAGNTLLNSASGGVRTVYIAFDDHVFAGSTIVAANAEAGYYGDDAAGSIAGVVNSSTQLYYKSLVNWISLQHDRRTGAFAAELCVTHIYGLNGRMAAGVRFRATDETTGDTGDIDVNDVVLSQEATQGNPFEVFRVTVPLTALAQGNRCILNAKIYPWLGDASAVLDLAAHGVATTGDWSNANPITPLRFFCDKTGGYGGSVAVIEAGASGGAVQATLAAARATPFPTLEAAYAALPAWNSTNKGHNDCGGADIYVRNMTGSPVTFTPAANITATAGKTWVNIRQDPANTAAASVTINASRTVPAYTRFLCPMIQSGSGVIAGGDQFKPLALEGMTLSCAGASAAINSRQAAFVMRNVTVTGLSNGAASPFNGAAAAAQKQQLAQCVGVIMEDGTVDASASGMFGFHGCRLKRLRIEDASRAIYTAMDPFDGIQFVATTVRDSRLASAPTIGAQNPLGQLKPDGVNVIGGFHAVGFIMESTAAGGGGGAWRLGGDGTIQPMDNVLVTYSTIPGTTPTHVGPPPERLNLAYTNAAGAVGVKKYVVIRFSIVHQINEKTDTFTADSTLSGRTKNWKTRYGVAHRGNVRVLIDNNGSVYSPTGANWSGEVAAPGSAIGVTVAFTDNKSGPGGAGGGDYTLTGATNEAYNRVPGAGTSGTQINGVAVPLTPMKFDLAGVARRTDGTGAAGAYENTSNPPITGAGAVTIPAPAVAGAGTVTITGGGGATVPAPGASGQGGLTPITGGGAGVLSAPTVSGAGTVVDAPITARGAITATAARTIKPSPVPSGSSSDASLPLSAEVWLAPFDPADRTAYAIDWSEFLAEGEQIAQIDKITMSAQGASLGIEVDRSTGRAPIISTDGTKTQVWFLCGAGFQSNPAFANGGVRIGLAKQVRTDATLFNQFERTGVLPARQQ